MSQMNHEGDPVVEENRAADAVQSSRDEMMDWIERIVAFGVRRPGYDASLEVESFLAACFVDFGLERVGKEPVPVNRWVPDRVRFRLPATETDVPCAAIPYTDWTDADGVHAPCVYVGDGTPDDFDGHDVAGKIVVVDARFADLSAAHLKANRLAMHDPGETIPDGVLHEANWLITNFSAYFEAAQRGARAFVGLLADSPTDGSSYYVPYDGNLKDFPAVWIGREHGETVRSEARRGREGHLVSRGDTRTVNSHNVVGCVPGRTDEIILLTCHHDAPFASAVEDGSGLAVLLALAKTFGAEPGRLERTLLFVAASGHFHGGVGNRVFVEKHRDDLVPKTVAAFGMEHIGHEVEPDGAGGYRLTGRPEVRAIFSVKNPTLVGLIEAGLQRHGPDRTIVVPPYLFGPEPPCDSAPFFTAGIPSACLISGPLYLFDEADTLDKVAADDLMPTAQFFSELVRAVDRIPVDTLEVGLTRRRDDPPAPPPSWFAPPEAYRRPEGSSG